MPVNETTLLEETKEQSSEILTPDKKDRRYLIFILQQVQEKLGYPSTEATLAIADLLEIPGTTVYGIATFYNQFRFTPLGRRSVKLCMGTARHLAGGRLVLEAMAREREDDDRKGN